jgi:hypothetical protein
LNKAKQTLSSALRFLAWLPGILSFFFYFWLLPVLYGAWPTLFPFMKRLLLLTEKYALIPLALTFALALAGLIYQTKIRRSWWDVPFMFINMAFVLVAGLVLILVLLGIDLMPRQL